MSYYQLNFRDRYQAGATIVAICTSMVFGLLEGYNTLTFTFMILPWVLLFGLLASDAFHTGMKLREHFRSMRLSNDKGRVVLVESKKEELEQHCAH